MKVIKSIKEMMDVRKSMSYEDIGYVPTMGVIHEGHLSLIKKAQSECSTVIVSIFLNPTQFNSPKDLSSYPSDTEKDLECLRNQGVDYAFLPNADEIYADKYRYKVTESSLSKKYCGVHRSGHFDGVLTVVLKLFHIVRPHRAYFGEKDYQQLALVRDMVKALFLPIQIIACPTVREKDGLAISSRNQLLHLEDQSRSSQFYKVLAESLSDEEARKKLEKLGFEVDYVETFGGRRLGAIKLGSVRLIDNVEI